MPDPKRRNPAQTFTPEEQAAMQERAQEQKAEATRRRSGKAATKGDGTQDVLDKIAGMAEADRLMAQRLHAVVMDAAPELEPRLWYGMPAYARGGKVVCFFQDARKFKTRYATLGFSDSAALDDGTMWPSAYALTDLDEGAATRIAALVRQAVSR